MRRTLGRPTLLIVALALIAGACSGDDTATTTVATLAPDATSATTTATTLPVVAVTSTTTTTTLPPGGPAMVTEGDDNETVEAFQWLINCVRNADLTVDGEFGPGTLTAVMEAQTFLGLAANGLPDEEMFASLSRSCSEDRRITTDRSLSLVGNTAPLDPERYRVAMVFGSTLTVLVFEGDVAVTVTNGGGEIVEPNDDGTSWSILTTGDYLIQVDAVLEPATFVIDVDFEDGTLEEADWFITTSGISYRGTKLSRGDAAGATITNIYDFLGHGVRSGFDEYDTGWDFPGQEGFRGIVIEGFRFLFYGPNAENPGRPETFGRVRVVAPGTDANGDPRPFNYVTTPQGIGVGNTLTDLVSVYDDFVNAGSNSDEHYYRLSNSGGELCFYFGPDAPTDSSPILEISTECRD